MTGKYDVVIVGAGLSGLSCAVDLVDAGLKVLVLEARSVLGGRTSSWNQGKMTVESGLHRFLGFYDALPNLLEHVGVDVDEIVQWVNKIQIRMVENKESAEFNLAPSTELLDTALSILGNNDFISPAQKAKLTGFFTQGFWEFSNNKMKLDNYSVAKYAEENGINQSTIKRVLVPLTEGLFFLSVNEYSALNFFALFAPYLTKLQKTKVGAFKGGMTEVMIMPIADYLTNKGGQIWSNLVVDGVLHKKGKVEGVSAENNKFYAQHVVLATSLFPAQRIIKKTFPDNEWFKPMLNLSTMPSVTMQIELTKPSSNFDGVVFGPDSIMSSFAEESRTTFPQSRGRLSIILTDAKRYLKRSGDEIIVDVLAAAKGLKINMSENTIKTYQKVNWENDFYSYEKGTYKLRPSQKTAVEGLYLAGDYTKQKYLQTMEGAVVSGKLAAEKVLSS